MVSGSHRVNYLRVDCQFLELREKAVQICQDKEGMSEKFWVPRSLLHGADDNHLQREEDSMRLVIGDRLELRIESWFCEKEDIDGVVYSVR